MRFSPVIAIALCLLLAACTGSLQDPTPGVGPEWANQPWRVHCETANTLALDIKAVRGIYDGRWLVSEGGSARYPVSGEASAMDEDHPLGILPHRMRMAVPCFKTGQNGELVPLVDGENARLLPLFPV